MLRKPRGWKGEKIQSIKKRLVFIFKLWAT